MNKDLMIVVYTGLGHTYTFYDVSNIKYHNKNLEFDYLGFSGETHAQFNDIVGMTKHKGIANPKKHNVDKEHYNNLLPCGKHKVTDLCDCEEIPTEVERLKELTKPINGVNPWTGEGSTTALTREEVEAFSESVAMLTAKRPALPETKPAKDDEIVPHEVIKKLEDEVYANKLATENDAIDILYAFYAHEPYHVSIKLLENFRNWPCHLKVKDLKEFFEQYL